MALRAETPPTDGGGASQYAEIPTSRLGTRLTLFLSRRFHLVILLILLIAALALRTYGQQWDNNTFSHPDERFIFMQMNRIDLPSPVDIGLLLSSESPLNPRSFNYGSLTYYLLRVASVLLSELGGLVGVEELISLTSFDGISSVGRSLATLFDLGTIVLVYVIGRRLYSRETGLLAAAFTTFAVIHIQLSHFYAADTLMTFFVTLTMLSCVLIMRGDSYRYPVLVGVALSLALASKVSALPVLVPVGVALLLRAFSSEDHGGETRFRRPAIEQFNRGFVRIAIVAAVSAATFVIVQPYALIDAQNFFGDVVQQSEMARGISDLPYTRQYADRTDYLYFLQNLALFGLGLPLGLVAIGGWIYGVARLLRRPNLPETVALVCLAILSIGAVLASSEPFVLLAIAAWVILLIHLRGSPRRAEILLLSFLLPYFLITGSFHAKFLRYLLPITPLLMVIAAEALWRLRSWAKNHLEISPLSVAGAASTDLGTESAVGTGAILSESQVREPPPPATAFRYSWLERAKRTGLLARLATAFIALVLLTTALHAIAFVNIYSEKHSSITASEWIYKNVPAGSTYATEHWEEGMPKDVTIDGRRFTRQTLGYRELKLNLYEPDTPTKLGSIVSVLREADYIIFFSNRLYGTIPRLPERYPLTSKYYNLLFGEQLGFELEAAFAKYPNLFGIYLTDDTLSDPGLPTPRLLSRPLNPGIQINLGRADESFTVYDHPKVLVFKKTRQLSNGEYRDLLNVDLSARPYQPARTVPDTQYKSLTLDPVQQAQVESGGTFADMFDRDGITNRIPLIVWLVLVWLTGIAALPLTFRVFQNLPDRGILFSRVLGLLILAWLVWWLVNLGLTNTRLTVAGVFIAMLAAGLSAIYFQRDALLKHWRDNRRLILIGEGVFLAAFLIYLGIRALNPDLWHPSRGGEKPMDIAYLMAAIKTPLFPPYDPWFAGGYLNYYYFGQVVVGTLIKLSGILPTTAYNLVVPLLYALVASGVFSVVYNLVRRVGQVSPMRPVAAGLLGAVLATTLGNLGGFGQIVGQLARSGGASIQSDIPGLGSVAATLAGTWNVTLGGKEFPIETNWYWASTRVLEGTINEFPFFTFLYADLHAHMIALPFTVMALALALNFVKSDALKLRAPSSSLPPGALQFAATTELPRFSVLPIAGATLSRLATFISFRELILLGTAGLVVGSLYPMNSWDYPTYLGLVSLAILAPWYFASDRSTFALGASILRILVVFITSWFLFFLPFSLSFQSFYSGIRWIPDKSNVGGYLVIHGLFLVIMTSYLLLDLARRYRRSGSLRMLGMLIRWWDRMPRALRLSSQLTVSQGDMRGLPDIYIVLSLLAVVILSIFLKAALAGIAFALLVWVAFAALQRDRIIEESWALVLFGTGLALTIFTELFAIDGDVGRMNTVFKFYMQIWILWSVATIVALVGVRRWLTDTPPFIRRLWLGVLVALFVCASVYPVVSTYARVRDRFNEMPPSFSGSLDGSEYMQTAVYVDRDRRLEFRQDLLAIEWIQDNIQGTPTILEATTPLYRWGSRISVYTGLPTVIGWHWHQTQQRLVHEHLIDQRLLDVRAMFDHGSLERTWALLDQYGVDLIYLGDLERAYYPAAEVKLDRLAEMGLLQVEYEHLGVKIYRVID